MNEIKELILPMLKKYWKLLVSTLIVSALGCAIMTGLSSSHLSLKNTLDEYIEKYNYPSAQINTGISLKDKLDSIKQLEDVKEVNTRLSGDTTMISPSGKYLSTRVFLYDDDNFQKYHFWFKDNSELEDGIMLEYNFAKDNNISIGDTVSLKVGNEYRDYKVSAVISLPEALATQISDKTWATNSDFGFVYASSKFLKQETKKEKEEARKEVQEKEQELENNENDANQQMEESKQKLDEARNELNSKKTEFLSLKNELLNKESELIDGKNKLEDTRVELENGKNELENKKYELQTGKIELENAKTEISNNKNELINKQNELKIAEGAIEKATIELNTAKSKLTEAKNGLDEINSALNELNEQYNMLTNMNSIVDIIEKLPEDTSISKIYEVKNKIQGFIDIANEYDIPIDIDGTIQKVSNNLSDFMNQVLEDRTYFHEESTISLIDDIKNEKEGIKETEEYNILVQKIKRYNPLATFNDIQLSYDIAMKRNARLATYLEKNSLFEKANIISNFGTEKTLTEIFDEIEKYRNLPEELIELTDYDEIETTGTLVDAYYEILSKLKEKIDELQALRKSIIDELLKQNISEDQIDSKLIEIELNLTELESQNKQIKEGIPQIEHGLSELDNGLNEVESNIGQINNGLNVIDTNLIQIFDGMLEVDNNIAKIDEAIPEIINNIQLGESELNKAQNEIEFNQNQLNEKILEAKNQFAELRQKIKEAFEEIANRNGYEDYFNQVLLKFNKNVNSKEMLELLKNKLKSQDIKLLDSFTYEDSSVKNRIDINLEPIETMSTFIPIIFFVITLIVVFLFMSLMIKQCRKEIGILRALGFTQNQIKRLFCLVNFVVSLGAIILGTLIGWGLTKYVCSYYADFFPLPFFRYTLNGKMYLLAVALTIVVGQIATIISATSITKIAPSEAMTREAPETAKVSKVLEKATSFTSPFTKFNIISLLRNKIRFIFSVICISASIMMIFSAIAFILSKNNILTEVYDDRIHYDAQIFLKEKPDENFVNELKNLDFTHDVEVVDYYDTTVKANGIEENVIINTVPSNNKMIKIYDSAKNEITVNNDGIVLERHTAERLGVKKGDTIELNNAELKISAISEQSVNRIQYISKEQAKNIGDADLGTIILNIKSGKEQELLKYLSEKDNYLYTSFTNLSLKSYEKIFETYDLAAWIIIIFAIVIGFVIVINTALTNLLEQKKKLCMLRILGFRHSQISRSWFGQSILQFITACIIGLPAGIYIAKIGLKKLSTVNREYVFVNNSKEYVITLLLVFLYILVSHIISMNSLKKWNITETVKEKE